MSKKQSIILGTVILTLTGFLSRFIGFFYRIFLSRVFGEEGIGLYQLIFPVYALCISFSISGIETALSRTVARKQALGKLDEAKEVLLSGLTVAFFLSFFCTFFIQKNAFFIADRLLHDSRCKNMLIILSYAFPFCAIHSCICGYYYGLKETKIPAISQLIEQSTRILSVYIFFFFLIRKGHTVSISIAVSGLVIGELFSTAYAAQIFNYFPCTLTTITNLCKNFPRHLRELLSLSIPLTTNRVLINLLQSIEAISIPVQLRRFQYSASESLRIYGVLNGMALPCILFPTAVTSSLSIMLMPTVAEIQAAQDPSSLLRIIKKVSRFCFSLGLFSCLCFLLFGHLLGNILFHSDSAGNFIVTLSWICPFLYVNSSFLSIINGLGKTGWTFLINTFGLSVRILSVFYIIPLFGIQGYLWGLLSSQLLVSLLCILLIYHWFSINQ